MFPDLEKELFGVGPTTEGAATGRRSSSRSVIGPTGWEGAGADRLELEDQLQRPAKEGGPEEARYIVARAEREYQYAVDHGGSGRVATTGP